MEGRIARPRRLWIERLGEPWWFWSPLVGMAVLRSGPLWLRILAALVVTVVAAMVIRALTRQWRATTHPRTERVQRHFRGRAASVADRSVR